VKQTIRVSFTSERQIGRDPRRSLGPELPARITSSIDGSRGGGDAFHDNGSASSNVGFTIRHSYACGHECANGGMITTEPPDGVVSQTEWVIVFRLNDAGRPASLADFWEFEGTAASAD